MDIGEVFNAMLACAAAITAGCAYVHAYAACIIGAIGTITYMVCVPFVGKKLRIDDPLNAVAVHCGGGSVGAILLGFFHTEAGLFYSGEGWLLASQVIGLTVILANAAFWTTLGLALFTVIVGPIRVPEKIELLGCDAELDGMLSYEESADVLMQFQQIRVHPELYAQMCSYLKTICAYDAVLFYDAIEKYESEFAGKSVDAATKDAQAIVDAFLAADAAQKVAIPEWQSAQIIRLLSEGVKSDTMSASLLLKGIFTIAKAEIISLIDSNIATNFRKTPMFNDFSAKAHAAHSKPLLGFIGRMWCCNDGKKAYGRAKPFDPFKKFNYTEGLQDDTDVEDNLMDIAAKPAPKAE